MPPQTATLTLGRKSLDGADTWRKSLAGKWGPRIESMYGSYSKWGYSSNRYVCLPEGKLSGLS